jgi:hypothetical protein
MAILNDRRFRKAGKASLLCVSSHSVLSDCFKRRFFAFVNLKSKQLFPFSSIRRTSLSLLSQTVQVMSSLIFFNRGRYYTSCPSYQTNEYETITNCKIQNAVRINSILYANPLFRICKFPIVAIGILLLLQTMRPS